MLSTHTYLPQIVNANRLNGYWMFLNSTITRFCSVTLTLKWVTSALTGYRHLRCRTQLVWPGGRLDALTGYLFAG